jgi:hypothetical protein
VDTVDSFFDEARSYCALIEDPSATNSPEFTRACLQSILRLFERALLLPRIDDDSVGLPEGIGHETWAEIGKRISDRLPPDYYRVVLEPLELEPTPEPTIGFGFR